MYIHTYVGEQVLTAQGVTEYGENVKHGDFMAKFLTTNSNRALGVPVGGRQGSQTQRDRPSTRTLAPVDRDQLLTRIQVRL